MFNHRQIDLCNDKNLIIEFHCQINYASDTPWARKNTYEQYREKWFSTSQPNEFYSYLEETLQDERTLAEILLDENNNIVGYLWVIFSDIKDYGLTIAEVMDVMINSEFQKRGFGYEFLKYIEEKSRERGASLLRSETGIENIASQKLHDKFGFEMYRILYEKKLS